MPVILGALYSNFDGKEDLFVAVIHEEQARHLNVFQSLLKEEPSGKKRLRRMRDAIADLMTDHDWIVLRAEFEVGALRSERIQQSFVEVHRQQLRDGSELVRDLLRSPEVTSKLKPDDFITVITISLMVWQSPRESLAQNSLRRARATSFNRCLII